MTFNKDQGCKYSSNIKWGHVSKATLFPWLFVAASNRKTALELKLCLIYHRTIQLCDLYWHGHTQQLFFFSKQQSFKKSFKYQGHAAGLKMLHHMRGRGKSQTEKITGNCFDLVLQYCRDAQVIKVQTDRATTEGKAKWGRGTGVPARQGETI